EIRGRDAVIRSQSRVLAAANMKAQREHMEGELDRAVGRLSRQVVHDLRSPLSAMKMITQTMASDEKVGILKTAVHRVEATLDELSNFVRSKKHALEVKLD